MCGAGWSILPMILALHGACQMAFEAEKRHFAR